MGSFTVTSIYVFIYRNGTDRSTNRLREILGKTDVGNSGTFLNTRITIDHCQLPYPLTTVLELMQLCKLDMKMYDVQACEV